MNISFNIIPEGVRNAYNNAAIHVGYIRNVAVKVINYASNHVQDRNNAIAAMALTGFVSCELSIIVSRLFGEAHEVAFGRYQDLSDSHKNRLGLGLAGVMAVTYSATNYAVYKALRIPLTPWQCVAISVGSASVSLFFKIRSCR